MALPIAKVDPAWELAYRVVPEGVQNFTARVVKRDSLLGMSHNWSAR